MFSALICSYIVHTTDFVLCILCKPVLLWWQARSIIHQVTDFPQQYNFKIIQE